MSKDNLWKPPPSDVLTVPIVSPRQGDMGTKVSRSAPKTCGFKPVGRPFQFTLGGFFIYILRVKKVLWIGALIKTITFHTSKMVN